MEEGLHQIGSTATVRVNGLGAYELNLIRANFQGALNMFLKLETVRGGACAHAVMVCNTGGPAESGLHSYCVLVSCQTPQQQRTDLWQACYVQQAGFWHTRAANDMRLLVAPGHCAPSARQVAVYGSLCCCSAAMTKRASCRASLVTSKQCCLTVTACCVCHCACRLRLQCQYHPQCPAHMARAPSLEAVTRLEQQAWPANCCARTVRLLVGCVMCSTHSGYPLARCCRHGLAGRL
jgi:hypothetical protein